MYLNVPFCVVRGVKCSSSASTGIWNLAFFPHQWVTFDMPQLIDALQALWSLMDPWRAEEMNMTIYFYAVGQTRPEVVCGVQAYITRSMAVEFLTGGTVYYIRITYVSKQSKTMWGSHQRKIHPEDFCPCLTWISILNWYVFSSGIPRMFQRELL